MKKLTFILAAIFIFGVSNLVEAQNSTPGVDKKSASHGLNIGITSHAMIALAGTQQDIDFEAEAADDAGDKVSFTQTNGSSLWLNYSSIVSKNSSNTISAEISEVPDGLSIEVLVSETAATSKKGHTGKGYTKTLTEGGVVVVDGIKSCYTGAGENKGHSLVYSVSADDANYDKIEADDHTLTVTYTITEN